MFARLPARGVFSLPGNSARPPVSRIVSSAAPRAAFVCRPAAAVWAWPTARPANLTQTINFNAGVFAPAHAFASRAVPTRGPSTPAPSRKGPQTRYENMLVNEELLKHPVVRIKGEAGLRELPTQEAIAEARSKKLDLVCALLRTDPPICTIEDATAANFHNQKKAKALAKAQRARQQGVKGMRFKGRIMEADMQMKLKKMVQFMEKGDDVQVEIQKAHSNEQAEYVFNRCVVALYELGAPTIPFSPSARIFTFKKNAKHQHPIEHYTAQMENLATASQKAIEAQDAARRKQQLERKLARRKLIMERKGRAIDDDEDDSDFDSDMSDIEDPDMEK